MSVILSLQDATIGYPNVPILESVNLEIARGDAFALLGPNGSGKTTLLKTLAGILPPLEGAHRLAARQEATVVGYVPQRKSLSLLLPMTVREVVNMGTYAALKPWQGVGRKEQDRVSWALEAVGLLERATERYSNLSGGQQQRVLIARSLATNPALLILDEPLASLDQASMESLITLFKQLREERQVAFLWADHMVPTLEGIVREAIAIQGKTIVRGSLEEMVKLNGLQTTPDYLGHLR